MGPARRDYVEVGQDELDSCSADVSVGLQRVNVNNPGGTDLGIDLALCFDLV